MPREVSDEEYNYFQGRKQVADFVESIYNDPALAKEAKALIKKKYPTLNIPDYDLEQKVEARLDKEREEREKRESEDRQKKQDEEFKASRDRTQKEYGFTDDAMKELESFMVERNIGDYEVAATFKASKEPKTSDPNTGWDSTRWHHERQEGFAEIAKDPEAWGRTELTNAFTKAASASNRR